MAKFKLINGDCINILNDIIKTGNKVDLIVTDPPYKTTSRGSSGGTGGMLKDQLFKDGMVFKHNDVEFSDWLSVLFEILKDGGHAYIMTNNKNLKNMLIAIEDAGFNIFKTLVWAKNTAITNMYYMDSHEYIIFCRKGKSQKINNCGTKSVLNFDNPREKLHPTEKPVDLMKVLIDNSSSEGEIVLDPFMGSGSTGVACMQSNRNFIGIEIDENYFNIIYIKSNYSNSNYQVKDKDSVTREVLITNY